MGVNDITGDSLVSKATSKAYADGWERIFNAKRIEEARAFHESSGAFCGVCKESGDSAIGCAGICVNGQTQNNGEETP